MSSKEKQDGREKVVEIDRKTCQIFLTDPNADRRTDPKSFTFEKRSPKLLSKFEKFQLFYDGEAYKKININSL